MPNPTQPQPPAMRACCDMHGQHCEPPSELCCRECGEASHPEHPPGVHCVIDPRAVAAAQRAAAAGQAEVYVAAGIERIKFTDQGFIAWYLNELVVHEAMVRALVAGEMFRAAAGREEYANGAPEGARVHLLVQVDTFKTAAEIAGGDPQVMCGVMPVRMWTEAEERAARGEA